MEGAAHGPLDALANASTQEGGRKKKRKDGTGWGVCCPQLCAVHIDPCNTTLGPPRHYIIISYYRPRTINPVGNPFCTGYNWGNRG